MHARTEDLLKIRDGEPVDAALRERVLACPHCSSELERLRRMKSALAELPGLEVPAGVWERVLAESAGPPNPRPAATRRWPISLAAAAAVLAAVGVGLLVQAPRAPELTSLAVPETVAPDSIATERAPGEGRSSDPAAADRLSAETVTAQRAAETSDAAETSAAAETSTAAERPAADRAAVEDPAAEAFASERPAAETFASERFAREDTRVARPFSTFQGDAPAVHAAGLSAAPRLELPPAYAALAAESARLERLLAELPPQRRLMSADIAGTIAVLEDRIAWLDEQLTVAAAQGFEPRARQALWSERVDVMNALVQVRYAQIW